MLNGEATKTVAARTSTAAFASTMRSNSRSRGGVGTAESSPIAAPFSTVQGRAPARTGVLGPIAGATERSADLARSGHSLRQAVYSTHTVQESLHSAAELAWFQTDRAGDLSRGNAQEQQPGQRHLLRIQGVEKPRMRLLRQPRELRRLHDRLAQRLAEDARRRLLRQHRVSPHQQG